MRFKDYLAFVPSGWRLLAYALVLAGAQGVVIMGLGLSVRHMFDRALPENNLVLVAVLCGGLLLLYVLDIAVQGVTTIRISRIVQVAMARLCRRIADHAFLLPRAYYSRADLGSIHADWVQETGRVEATVRGVTTIMAPHVVSALTVAVFMLVLNFRLSLLCWSFLAAGFLVIMKYKPRVQRAVHDMHKAHRQYSKHVLFILEMMDLIRVRHAEGAVREAHREVAETNVRRVHELVHARTIYSAILRLMVSLMMVALLFVGGYLVLRTGALTLGGLLAFFAVAGVFRNSLNQILAQVPTLMDGAEAFRRISRFLDIPDRAPYNGCEPCGELLPLRLERVSFSYEGETPLFRDLDLTLDPGNILVLTGPSGTGKSTLGLLLLGWFRPAAGRLTASGVAYDRVDMGAIRSRTGVVLQDAWLFSGTLRENLLFGLSGTDPAEVRRALKMAEAEAFIERLPEGLDTCVGERGVRLSGGEKQRLAIARALIGRTDLLLLDEPDNHLDGEYLVRLIERIRRERPACAIVLITHTPPALEGTSVRLHLTGEEGGWLVMP